MRIIPPILHGIADYIFVVILWIAPTVFDFGGFPQTLCYIVGSFYLINTIIQKTQAGVIRGVPIGIHTWIDFLFGAFMIVSPFLFAFDGESAPKLFFIIGGIIIALWGLITDSDPNARAAKN